MSSAEVFRIVGPELTVCLQDYGNRANAWRGVPIPAIARTKLYCYGTGSGVQ